MKFISVWVNRMKIILSDRLFIIAMVVIPLLAAMIMGYTQRKEKLGYIPVAIVDEDRSSLSQTLCERFSQKEGMKAILCSREAAMALLRDEKAEAALMILSGFESGLKSGNTKGSMEIIKSPSSVSAELIKELAAAEVIRMKAPEFAYDWIVSRYKENNADSPEVNREDVWSLVESYWLPEPMMTIQYEEISGSPVSQGEVSIPPFAAASSGILILFIMLALLFGSGWICEERSNGTLNRIFSSPGALLPVFLGNTLALFVLGLLQTIIFVTVQRIFFDVSMLSGIFAWLVMASYILSAAAISMLMASLFRTAARLQAAAPVFAVITGFMGGCLWNLAGIPKELETVSHLTPQGWALSSITALYTDPGQANYALPTIMVLLLTGMVLLTLSYILLKFRKKAV